MKAQFNLIKSANQNIKVNVEVLNLLKDKSKFKSFIYNEIKIFNYSISVNKSQILIKICPLKKLPNHFDRCVIGSFIYDHSIKFEASITVISCSDQDYLNSIVFGFRQKNFIFSKYKNKSLIEKYKTSYKLNKKNTHKLKSINFLKELVSEPSNVIYPETFVSRTQKAINKSEVSIKILDQKNKTNWTKLFTCS